jgi:uncharacterized membrane protein (DUF373 family)
MPKYDTDSNREDGVRVRSSRPSAGELEDSIATFSCHLLDRGDSIIYAIVGACFFLGALFALGYSFLNFGLLVTEALAGPIFIPDKLGQAIIQLVSDLLLVLIIMEVLSTVIHYLREHATSLRPFLFIGIVSATRGILSIGARLSVGGEKVSTQEFTTSMIELAINATVILALGITLKLLGKMPTD